VRRLVRRAGLSPSWSPDGKRIAYLTTTLPQQGVFAFHVMTVSPADGEPQELLYLPPVPLPDNVEAVLAWSPDGAKIAIVLLAPRRYPEPQSHARELGLYVASADGSGLHLLTHAATAPIAWRPIPAGTHS
jgi:Tol biopolymer transport system component